MNVPIAYHFPLDLKDQYYAYQERFAQSLQHPPCKLVIALSRPEQGDEPPIFDVSDFLHLSPLRPVLPLYEGGGCDIGSFIHVCKSGILDDYDFAVFCGATTYFPKSGWLERLIEAREKHGEGLYGISASFEGSPLKTNPAPHPHIRTSCFACNPKLLAAYPKTIASREDCYRFENGEWRISLHISPTRVVYWDSVCDLRDCRNPPNIFRRGSQQNLLVHDRRTDEYAQANLAEKSRLERLADGDVVHFPV